MKSLPVCSIYVCRERSKDCRSCHWELQRTLMGLGTFGSSLFGCRVIRTSSANETENTERKTLFSSLPYLKIILLSMKSLLRTLLRVFRRLRERQGDSGFGTLQKGQGGTFSVSNTDSTFVKVSRTAYRTLGLVSWVSTTDYAPPTRLYGSPLTKTGTLGVTAKITKLDLSPLSKLNDSST